VATSGHYPVTIDEYAIPSLCPLHFIHTVIMEIHRGKYSAFLVLSKRSMHACFVLSTHSIVDGDPLQPIKSRNEIFAPPHAHNTMWMDAMALSAMVGAVQAVAVIAPTTDTQTSAAIFCCRSPPLNTRTFVGNRTTHSMQHVKQVSGRA
jgi:hypothetical protein